MRRTKANGASGTAFDFMVWVYSLHYIVSDIERCCNFACSYSMIKRYRQ